MLSYLFLAILFVARTHSLSSVTDDKAQPIGPDGQTTTCRCRSEDAQSDILRQLLNQETLIRMALDRKVSDLVNDMADTKKYVQTSTKQLQDAKAEIGSLRNEVLLLKNQNRKSKADALEFQEKINVRFVTAEENITQVVNNLEQFNTNLNERFETFQTSTSYNIVDIQTKMDVLNMSLLDLKKQTTKLNTSLLEAIDKKLTDVSANWNRSLSELNHRFVYTCSKMDNDHANKMEQLSGTLS